MHCQKTKASRKLIFLVENVFLHSPLTSKENQIGEKGAIELAKGFKHMSLVQLSLSSIYFSTLPINHPREPN
jgi:hypothetical protein